MCLYKGTNKHKIAQEDIVCYKVIKRSKYNCVTFYVEHPIYSGIPIVPNGCMSVDEMDRRTELFGQVVHAFQSDALPASYLIYIIEIIDILNRRNTTYDLALMECIIPKGTVYYENICNDLSNLSDGIPQYGATKIIPVKIVRYYTHFVSEYK